MLSLMFENLSCDFGVGACWETVSCLHKVHPWFAVFAFRKSLEFSGWWNVGPEPSVARGSPCFWMKFQQKSFNETSKVFKQTKEYHPALGRTLWDDAQSEETIAFSKSRLFESPGNKNHQELKISRGQVYRRRCRFFMFLQFISILVFIQEASHSSFSKIFECLIF